MNVFAEFECIMDRINIPSGNNATKGDTICYVSIMKIITSVQAPVSGVVQHKFSEGDYIMEGDLIATVGDTNE